MIDRSLAALGMDGVPVLDPLTYPGRTITDSALLRGRELLPVAASAERMGRWPVAESGAESGAESESESGPGSRSLDEVLDALGQPLTGLRHPVIAIGSNAAPGQVSYKLSRLGLPVVVPMTPLRVSGIGIGVSGHVSPAGYVAISPFFDPGGVAEVALTCLDDQQLRAVDGSEYPEYRRVLLPGDEFSLTLPSGERLEAAYLYVNANGVLAGSDGVPMATGTQTELIGSLLARSPRLRALFDSPEDWVAKAGADPQLRAEGLRIFNESGWVQAQEKLLSFAVDRYGKVLDYDDVSSLTSAG